MKTRGTLFSLCIAMASMIGCDRIGHMLSDEGAWLGERVATESAALRVSSDSERVFAYAPDRAPLVRGPQDTSVRIVVVPCSSRYQTHHCS